MFAQSDPDRIRTVLASADYDEIAITPVTVTLRLGSNPGDATDYLRDTGPARAVLETITPEQLDRALEDVTAVLADHAGPDGVQLDAGIWITTRPKGPLNAESVPGGQGRADHCASGRERDQPGGRRVRPDRRPDTRSML